jgi:uncharacterized protein YkuJ
MKNARRNGFRSGWAWMPTATAVGVGIVCMACGGESTTAKSPVASRSEGLAHEDCSGGARTESFDTNGDGVPDIRRYFDRDGHELCRVADVNHDGKPDLYEYFSSSGTIRRREYCYDDLGVVNAIEYYEAGKLARREYDVSGRNRIDTWDWFDPNATVDAKTGRPTHPLRRERDTTGDGQIDQWWTWSGDRLSIANDRDGDGRPDPDTAFVFGEDAGSPATGGGISPESSASPPAPAPPPGPADSGPQGTAGSSAGGDGGRP